MGNKLGYPEVDLSGKVVIVTGGNTGIGYETAKGLARLGAHTFIACRSKERAEAAIERIKSELGGISNTSKVSTARPREEVEKKEPEGSEGETGGLGEETGGEGEGGVVQEATGDSEAKGESAAEGEQDGGSGEVKSKDKETSSQKKEVKVDFLPLDLSSLQSTTEFVRAFKEKNLPLHILINNAGIAIVPFRKTDDGFESHFQVNHLSHMLLTLELLPILLDTAASSGDVRIINLTSSMHYQAESFNSDKLNKSEEEYKRMAGYSNSKLQNVLTGFALQRRLQGKNITVSSVHPGLVKTEVDRGFQDWKVFFFMQRTATRAVGRTPIAGAATTLDCAVNPELNSQQHFYYDSCRPKQPSSDSRNERFQEELWKRSFEFLKEHLSSDTVERYGPKPDDQGEAEVSNGQQGGEAEVSNDQQEVN